MSEGDGAAEHRLTLAELAAVVKRLNRTSEFGTAVSEILTQVRRASRDAGATADAAFVDALFVAVMRAGTVLKTRHAEGSAGWVQGRELFLEALDGGCFEVGHRQRKIQQNSARSSSSPSTPPTRTRDPSAR